MTCDLAIVGGGLAGGLIALALAEMRPALDVRLVEGGDRIGGNHLWSFFAGDIGPADQWIVAPLIAHRWPRYTIAFPQHRRVIDTGYRSIESARLDAACRRVLPARALVLGRRAVEVTPTSVALDDGTRIAAAGVIDTRGTGDLSLLDLGWQKFLGRELALAAPHDQPLPTIMDATVAQQDGYRFVYALPFAPDRMFVEDTYYSDGRNLDRATLRTRIDAYAVAHGWRTAEVVRAEEGALPIALDGDFEGYWRSGGI
ncbi:MAG: lycopene beta-cyclase CrtY, partial [Sphingomonas sp.]